MCNTHSRACDPQFSSTANPPQEDDWEESDLLLLWEDWQLITLQLTNMVFLQHSKETISHSKLSTHSRGPVLDCAIWDICSNYYYGIQALMCGTTVTWLAGLETSSPFANQLVTSPQVSDWQLSDLMNITHCQRPTCSSTKQTVETQ